MTKIRNVTGPRHFDSPPRGMDIAAAYRRRHGLADSLLVKGAKFPHRARLLLPNLSKVSANDAENLTAYVRRLCENPPPRDAMAQFTCAVSSVPGHDSLCQVLARLSAAYAEHTIDASTLLFLLPRVQVTSTQQRFLRSAIQQWWPETLAQESTPAPARYRWIEQMHFATWAKIAGMSLPEDLNLVQDELTRLAKHIDAHDTFKQHSHYGDHGLRGAIAYVNVALVRQGDVEVHERELALAHTFSERVFPHADVLTSIGLRLNPWATVHDMRQRPLIRMLAAGYETLGQHRAATDYLREWSALDEPLLNLALHHAPRFTMADARHRRLVNHVTAFESAPIDERELSAAALSETMDTLRVEQWGALDDPLAYLPTAFSPRITLGEVRELQVVEYIIAMGSYALYDAGNDATQVERIADTMWNMLSRADVYPHLAFFNSTRLALGILRDAMRWDGHAVPSFTPALRGYAACCRQGDAPNVERYRWEHCLQRLDPWNLLSPDMPIFDRARDYFTAALTAGYFDARYAESMQHSVTIHEPNHAAAAIVVHGDGEGA